MAAGRVKKAKKRSASQMSATGRITMKSRRRAKNRNRLAKFGIFIMMAILIGILSVQIVQLNRKNESYKEQEAQLQEQKESEESRTSRLKEKQEYVNSKEYVEDTAKSKLGMAYDDEIIFKEE